MSGERPRLYFDLASPYAYLAVSRAAAVLGEPVTLEPILLGAIFRARGFGSWAHTDARAAEMAEVEARAARYGLPLAWPEGWPANSLAAMRAATWARREGRLDAFAAAVYAAGFGRGGDIADLEVLAACAERAGLDPALMRAAIADPAIKEALRAATEAAWGAGVRGVPTLRVGEALHYGDDQLERAAGLDNPGAP